MDGNNSLNLIYEETLEKMQFDTTRIQHSSITLKGIIPRKEAWCKGKIALYVIFGTPENYRSEGLIFRVIPF